MDLQLLRLGTCLRSVAAWIAPPMLALLLGGAAPARADTCGAEGQRECGVTERIPSCDLNLVAAGGRCIRAICGAEGQRGCGPTERFLFDFVLQMPVPKTCDSNLVHDLLNNKCLHPQCGREGQRPCVVTERIPSCDINLFESGGKCQRPADCGREGQSPCDLTVRGPIFRCDVNLVVRTQKCARPGTPDTATAQNSGSSTAPLTATTPAPPPAAKSPAPPPPPPTATTAATGSIEADTDRMGSDVYGFPLTQADPAACQSACTVNAQCMAWTFVKAGVRGPQAQCFLKNAAPAPTRNACCVSGAKAAPATAAKSGGLLKPMR
jgi:hypothetical protein